MMRLSQELCIGVLGINALARPESNLAAFLRPPEPGLVCDFDLLGSAGNTGDDFEPAF